ncbi:MAG: hypothetical protein ABIF77_17290, partial [bacterium]
GLTLGDHEGDGGITAFGTCVEPDTTSNLAALAYWSFGPVDSTYLPIELDIIPSTFSEPDSALYVLDCTVDHQVDGVVLATGCTIGGAHESQPECAEDVGRGSSEDSGSEEEGGDLGPDGDGLEWPVVVDTGILYAYGHELDPPYVFTFENEQLHVNGVRLYPPIYRIPLTPGPGSEYSRAAAELSNRAYRVAYSLLEQGLSHRAIADSVANFLRRSGIVVAVTDVEDFSFRVLWEDSPYSIGFDLPRHPRPDDIARPTAEEKSRYRLTILERHLRRPGIVFCGEGYIALRSLESYDEIQEEIRVLKQTHDPEDPRLHLISGVVAKDLLNPVSLE